VKKVKHTTLTDNPEAFVWECILRELPGKRLVVLGRLNGCQVVAKFFIHAAKAKIEVDAHQLLLQANVLTPSIVYSGVDANTQHSVIIYDYIQQTEDSRAVWNSQNQEQRHRFMDQIVSILAKEHAHDLSRHDLHPNNFLISGEQCYALDPTSVKQASLSREACLKSLGELCGQIAVPLNDDYQHILKAYLAVRDWSLESRDEKILKRWQTQYRKKRENKYLEKLFRECTRVTCVKNFKRRIVCWRESYTPSMQTMLDNIDQAVNEGKILKAGNSNTIARVDVDQEVFVIKRYNMKNWTQRIKRIVKKNRAVNSWENAGRLFFHHVPTPMPIALVEHKWGPFRGKVYFVSRFEKGVSLDKFLKRENIVDDEKQFIKREVKSLLSSLKQLRLSHGDMKATNFLVTDNAVMITDLDGMRYHQCSHSYEKAFLVDKLRFLENWRHEIEYLDTFSSIFEEISL